ncbi:MAG: PTS sugar transporter subunit IIA, partial [Pseudobutyrivibrio sp.]|nr:PTS sugar transporter subunit IIA [Pseudobutyrivibrio sp.]
MRVKDLLSIESISLNQAPADKAEALKLAVDLMTKSGKITDKEAYEKAVFAREEEGSTGIGEGIAIPHGKCDAVAKPGLAAITIPTGVEFDALDGAPVDLIFLIAAPNTEDNIHVDVLSKLSMMLMDESFAANLKKAKTPEEFLKIVDEADSEAKSVDERLAAQTIEGAKGKILLAVTSCPTGIAHTYMAAEALENAAKAQGATIKVETRGSGGAKNTLTAKEIEAA